MNAHRSGDDLRWTASCYVLGELSAEKTSRFEALLLEDQSARDAVGDAVMLLQSAAACPVAPVAMTRKRSQAVRWASAAVSLGLLVGIAVFLSPKSTELADVRRPPNAEAASRAWLLELPELLDEQAAVLPAEAEEELEPIVAVEESDSDVPAWLILATAKRGAS